MKILFVHHNSVLGGAEISLAELLSGLSKNFTPVCAVPAGRLASFISSRGIHVETVPMRPIARTLNPLSLFSSGLNWLGASIKLVGICRRRKIQAIHANSLTAAIYAVPASIFCRIPLIWHERDLRRHPTLTPIAAKFAVRIIAISQAAADNLEAQLGKCRKIKVIYNGVDVERFRSASAKKISVIPDGRPIVLMAAQFVRWKRHDVFIRMASMVHEQVPSALFVLAGDTGRPGQQEYIGELKRMIDEKGLRDHFAWTGFVEDMPSLLHAAACVVLPSENEPFGRAVVEAMAAGRPVVAARSGAVPEIIEDGISGFLAPPGDFKAMADTVCKLLKEKPLANGIGEKGFLRFSQNFTIQRAVGEFEEMLKGIMKSD